MGMRNTAVVAAFAGLFGFGAWGQTAQVAQLPGFPEKTPIYKIEGETYLSAWVGAAVPVQRKGYTDTSVMLVPLSPLVQPARSLRMAAPLELVRPVSIAHQGLHMKAALVAEQPGEYTVTLISENVKSSDQRCILAFSLEGRVLWDQPFESDKALPNVRTAKMTFDITEPGLYEAVALLSCVLKPSVDFSAKQEINANRAAPDDLAPVFKVVLQHNGKIVGPDRPTFVSKQADYEKAAAGMRASAAGGAGKMTFSKNGPKAGVELPPGKVAGWSAQEARFNADRKLRIYDLGTTRTVPASSFRQAASDWKPPANATSLQQWQPAFKLSGTFIARTGGEYVLQHRVTSGTGTFELTEDSTLAIGEDVQTNLWKADRQYEAIEIAPATKTTGIWRMKLEAGRVYDMSLLAGILAFPDNTIIHEILLIRPGEAAFSSLRDDEVVHDTPK